MQADFDIFDNIEEENLFELPERIPLPPIEYFRKFNIQHTRNFFMYFHFHTLLHRQRE